MTIERTTRPYELLVRWGPEGVSGAHTQTIEEISENGVVIAAKLGDPVPVTLPVDVLLALNALVAPGG